MPNMYDEKELDLTKLAEAERNEVAENAAEPVDADPDTFNPLGAPVGVEPLASVGSPVIIMPTSAPKLPTDERSVEASEQPSVPGLLSASDVLGEGGTSAAITDEDLKAVMPDLDDNTFMAIASSMKINLNKYQKALVMNNGFTPQEALQAARKKMEKDGQEENVKYLEENPKVGIVEIDKKNEDKITFTPEEKAKLTKVKSIHLVVCEDQDLKSIPIKKIARAQKSSFLKMADLSLAHYSVPLPIYGDFVAFKGAQIVQLASATEYEDSKMEESIGKKASLMYDRLIGGEVLLKYEEEGGKKKTIMTYSEFVTNYPFYDMDLGMFGILCASSAEESTTTLTCGNCDTPFEWKFNIKALLNMDELSEKYKESIDNILGNKTDRKFLMEIHTVNMKTVRYKSPFSNNIYDISQPSIDDAMRIYSAVDQTDKSIMSAALIALFIRAMYIWVPEEENYIPIGTDPTDDETVLMLESTQSIPQKDVNMISQLGNDMVYMPKFILHSKCPSCGHRMTNNLKLDDMVFLAAQDSYAEMIL